MDGGLSADHCKRLEHVITRVRPDSSIVWCRISARRSRSSCPPRDISAKRLSSAIHRAICPGENSAHHLHRLRSSCCARSFRCARSGFWRLPHRSEFEILFLTTYLNLPQPLPEELCFPWDPQAGYYQAGVCVIDWSRVTRPSAPKRKRSLLGRGSAKTPSFVVTRTCSTPCWLARWHELPCTYNFCSQLLYIEEFRPKKERHRGFLRERNRLYSEAKVLHFAGQPKPWHHWTTDPGASLWVRALIRSGWLTSPRNGSLDAAVGSRENLIEIETGLWLGEEARNHSVAERTTETAPEASVVRVTNEFK